MIMLPKIKNCRKCGAFGILDEGISFDTKMRAKRFYYVYCVGCDLETRGCRTRTEAVKEWNRRQGEK
nr:MAG TPA: restriction alleviation protein [Caudoviricetes sp.]